MAEKESVLKYLDYCMKGIDNEYDRKRFVSQLSQIADATKDPKVQDNIRQFINTNPLKKLENAEINSDSAEQQNKNSEENKENSREDGFLDVFRKHPPLEANFNNKEFADIYKFLKNINLTVDPKHRFRFENEAVEYKIKVLKDDHKVKKQLPEIMKSMTNAKDAFEELCKWDGDDIENEKFKHSSDIKKMMKNFFHDYYNYGKDGYKLKGGEFDAIINDGSYLYLTLDNYLKKNYGNISYWLNPGKWKRYNRIKKICEDLEKLADLDDEYGNDRGETTVDWYYYKLDKDGKVIKKRKANEAGYEYWQTSELRKPETTREQTKQTVPKQTISKQLKNPVDIAEKTMDIRQQETGEKDELKDLDKDTVSKIRNQNAAREFYPGYESMISIQADEQKKAAVTRQMNSNNIEELRTWVADIEKKMKNDPKTYDQETAKFRDYLQHRLTKLEKIKNVIDKADENMQNHKVGELICSEDETGYKTYYVKDVKQPAIQSTHNGCWSVAISTLLKHRGVNLEQSAIRAYRPDQESFSNDFQYVNKDKANSISAYSDLIQSVLPNAAVNDAHYNSIHYHELSEKERNEEKNKVTEAMKTAITYAMNQGRGPVAMLVGGHYRTIYGLQEGKDGVTVTLCDPYKSEPQTLELKELAEQAWLPEIITDDDDPYKVEIVKEQFVFETQWLQDLKNIEGKMNLNEELDKKIEYENDGKLTIKKDTETLEQSKDHTHIVNDKLAENLAHSTYLPNKLRDIQLKKEINQSSREKMTKEELKKLGLKHAQEAPVTAGKIALDEKIPKQPKRTNSVSLSDRRKK